MQKRIITHSADETEEAARMFASGLTGGDVVALYGGLGAGKTAFVRGLAAGLGIDSVVSSPTFAIVHEYGGENGRPVLAHFDMYRVDGWDDLDTSGYYDYLESGAVLAVEWAENIETALPPGVWRVTLFPEGENERTILLEKES